MCLGLGQTEIERGEKPVEVAERQPVDGRKPAGKGALDRERLTDLRSEQLARHWIPNQFADALQNVRGLTGSCLQGMVASQHLRERRLRARGDAEVAKLPRSSTRVRSPLQCELGNMERLVN